MLVLRSSPARPRLALRQRAYGPNVCSVTSCESWPAVFQNGNFTMPPPLPTEPRKRGINWKRVGIIGPILIALIGGLWTVFERLNPPAPPEVRTIQVTYQVCELPQAQCPQGPRMIYPEKVDQWAMRECARFDKRRPQLPPGTTGKVLTIAVTCTKVQ